MDVDDQGERKHGGECSKVNQKQAFALKAQEPVVNLLGKVRLAQLFKYCDIPQPIIFTDDFHHCGNGKEQAPDKCGTHLQASEELDYVGNNQFRSLERDHK